MPSRLCNLKPEIGTESLKQIREFNSRLSSLSQVECNTKMAMKRLADEADHVRSRPRRENAKRTKLSPVEDANSSDPSSCSVSEDSALQSSPPASEHTRQSSLSSLHATSHEDDEEDDVSSSTSSDTSDDESEEATITVGGPKKPDISSSLFSDEAAEDVRSRLRTLLPQLAQANDLLLSGNNAHSMEDVEEDAEHIEMNLGLGVLEEKTGDGDNSSSSDGSCSDVGADQVEHEDLRASSGAVKRVQKDREVDAMGELLGKKTDQRKIGIEDLG